MKCTTVTSENTINDIGTMAVEGCLMITETVLYLAAFFSGLIAAITVGISRVSYAGDCLLFAEVNWCNSTSFTFSTLGNNGVCGFSIGLDIVTSFYALIVSVYHVCVFCKWADERRWVMLPSIITNAVCLVLLFINSCILSVGFKRFCSSMTSGQGIGSKVTECSADLSGYDWNRPSPCGEGGKSNHDHYTSGNFFGFLTTAQGASWFGVLFWLLLLISLIIRRIRDRPVLDPSSDKSPIASNLAI